MSAEKSAKMTSPTVKLALSKALRKHRHALLLCLVAVCLGGAALVWVVTVESPGNADRLAAARRLLHGGTVKPGMAGQDHAVVALPPTWRTEDKLAASTLAVRDAIAKAPAIVPTGFQRSDYLDLIAGVVRYFQPMQNDKGRIIDPYLGREVQYSTPAYALAAATLVASGKDATLLASASKALDSALFQLASGSARDGHGDFFITPAMLAYRLLKDKADPAARKRWDSYLREINPDIAYADRIGKGQANVINWNSSAIVGEFLRHKDGFTDDAFVNRYLDAQIIRFTPEGLYRDPGLPLTYDASARYNFLMLIEEGYDGKHREDLSILLERGAWLSLMMESPAGDAPTGGRSTEHVWNEALQSASFELWARRMHAAGDEFGARAFKRGAHLAARQVTKWVRPSGDFWIVKNRFDPALRRGFESYSTHSQYNLLAAAYLSMAWAAADDTIAEGASPADTGGFVVELPAFHKVFANSGGTYVEIETAADPHYNSTGLLRVVQGQDGAIGVKDNTPISDTPVALGVGWRRGDETRVLAGFSEGRVRTSVSGVEVTPGSVRFTIAYRLDEAGIEGVQEVYTLTPEALSVTSQLDGAVDSWRLTVPAFLSDGQEVGEAYLNGPIATIRSGKFTQRFEITAPAGALLKRTGRIASMRTGDYVLLEAEGAGNLVTYRLGAPVADQNALDGNPAAMNLQGP